MLWYLLRPLAKNCACFRRYCDSTHKRRTHQVYNALLEQVGGQVGRRLVGCITLQGRDDLRKARPALETPTGVGARPDPLRPSHTCSHAVFRPACTIQHHIPPSASGNRRTAGIPKALPASLLCCLQQRCRKLKTEHEQCMACCVHVESTARLQSAVCSQCLPLATHAASDLQSW